MALRGSSPNIMEALLRMQQLPGTVMPDYSVGQPDPMEADPSELHREALDARTKNQLAQALIGQGYVPNSGKLGILSQVFSTLVGSKFQRDADEKLSDVLERASKAQSAAAERKHQDDLAAEQRKLENDIKAAREKARAEAEARRDFAAPPGPIKMGTGDVLLDPATNKPLFSVPHAPREAPQASAEERQWAAYQKMSPDERAAYQQFKGLGNNPGFVNGTPAGLLSQGFALNPDGTSMSRVTGGPADLKASAAEQQKAVGSTDVGIAIASLRNAYDRLQKSGGITSTENNPLTNFAAYAASTPVGQAAGKAFGTADQSARNEIAMTRPALLAAIMKATGMSAKQMDSNAELKLWLATATDPTLDVESNRAALDAIEKKYLGGQPAEQAKAKTGNALIDRYYQGE